MLKFIWSFTEMPEHGNAEMLAPHFLQKVMLIFHDEKFIPSHLAKMGNTTKQNVFNEKLLMY